MDQPKGISLDEFLFKKIQPIKILVNNLNREMALSPGEQITVSRMEFDNLITTIEIFVEEYERVSQAKSVRAGSNRNASFLDMKKPPIKQVA